MTTYEYDCYVCAECDARFYEDQALTAPHPFREGEPVDGCPECKSLEVIAACDVRGCTNVWSCGEPMPSGRYRKLCNKHYREVGRPKGPVVVKR